MDIQMRGSGVRGCRRCRLSHLFQSREDRVMKSERDRKRLHLLHPGACPPSLDALRLAEGVVLRE